VRLLFISNFYPPHHLGGYELLCQEVATQFISRGHSVDVLTSTYGATDEPPEAGIRRRLHLQSDVHYYHPQQVLRYFPDRQANLRSVREALNETQPDVAVVWGMWDLSWSVAAEVEAVMGSRVAYYLANAWPMDPSPHEAYWNGMARSTVGNAFLHILRHPVARALRDEWLPCRLRLENVAICSRATQEQLRKAGIDTDRYQVIYHGIDVAVYRQAAATRQSAPVGSPLRVVFVGSLLPQKGVHTIIEALSHLAHTEPIVSVTLDILGAGHPAYEKRLHQMVEELQLGDSVTFHRPIPRTQLPTFLARFDALVLPSIWEEPMALISQEAMASGLVLVGTLTGGTKEILVDGENGLAFAPEDPEALARQLARLAEGPLLRQRLSEAALATVEARFTVEQTMNELESFLGEVVDTSGKVNSPR
jgi:glycogen synthase